MTFEDPFQGVYKKLLFNRDGTRLLGGILVGDATDYGTLLMLSKSADPLPVAPGELLLGKRRGPGGRQRTSRAWPTTRRSARATTSAKGQICEAIRDQGLTTLGEVKTCTKAGTGCGGCLPLVTDLLKAELKAAGQEGQQPPLRALRLHAARSCSRSSRSSGSRRSTRCSPSHGQGHGCEICKPAVASILASLWNENVLEHTTLQDTNDRFLANIQRGGLYSVVPRMPGGEITPEKLIVLGEVAKKYGLYTKITGGQRIDLFGAPVHQLPDIWEDLVDAGFESGHAYGKALRTVKSCVGTTWCRYGVQDSVGFAIRVEKRYKGIRAPHKLKAAVSGCIRECAEAQSKDFGLIATEKGWNLYVCGNGGAKPRHADLLAADLDEETAIKYIDRFLMYYIQTADRLTRTSVWLEKMEGGIEYLQGRDHPRPARHLRRAGAADAVPRRYLPVRVEGGRQRSGEAAALPAVRQHRRDRAEHRVRHRARPAAARRLADGFRPARAAVAARGADAGERRAALHRRRAWVQVGQGVRTSRSMAARAIKYGKSQIAVFHFASRGEWYASQNMCPHKQEMVLSRGIIGDQGGVPKVACPLHKKTFSLESGTCLSGEDYQVQVFPVKVEADVSIVDLPAEEELDQLLRPRTACALPSVRERRLRAESDSSTTSTRSPSADEFPRLPPRRPSAHVVRAFLYFDVSFMVWVLLGALANSIVPEFGLSDSQKGLMVAVPLLGGAMLRLVLGVLTDHIGARRTGILGMALTIIPLLLGWLWADSFSKVLLVGLLLGVAGASFAAALPLASRWYPPRYQGLGHGNRRGGQ